MTDTNIIPPDVTLGMDARTTGGMDLFNLAAGPITVVNPMQPARLYISTGYSTGIDGARHPSYDPVDLIVQVQQLTIRDLMQLEQMNLQGADRKIWLYDPATVMAVSRVKQLGGDLIYLLPTQRETEGTWWLVTSVMEKWDHPTSDQPRWIAVSVTQQLKGVELPPAPPPPSPPPPASVPWSFEDKRRLRKLLKLLLKMKRARQLDWDAGGRWDADGTWDIDNGKDVSKG